jgi:serine phosphatase RsbU (regulator of sigma subunit)
MRRLIRPYFLTILLGSAACGGFAQNANRVSGLLNILDRGCSDSMAVRLNLEIADEFIFNDPDTSRHFAVRALETARSIGDTLRMAKASNYIGIGYYSQGQYLSALEYYQSAQALSRAVNDRVGALKAINNIGIVYTHLGEHRKAISTYQSAFEENMALGYKNNAAYNLFNMAAGYLALEDIAMARYCVRRIEDLRREYAEVAIDPCSVMGEILLAEQKPDSALMCFSRAHESSRLEGDEYFMTSIRLGMARAYILKRSLPEADLEMHFAARTIRENGFDNLRLEYLEIMAELLSEQGLHERAYRAQKDFIQLKDSLDQVNSFNRIRELNARYESERQTSQIARQEQMLQEKSSQFRLAVMGGGALCFFAIAALANLIRKRRLNALLKMQNREISQQRQKMLSSIDYARRIQSAILPSDQMIARHFGEYFVFLRARDIVSGDIYWCQELDGKIYLAVIDCTGHGVPGAFMSLIAYSKLNQVISDGHRELQDILWAMHGAVVSMLNQDRSAESTQDGMDMSLCRIDRENGIVEYCGANSPVSLYSAGELTEYRVNPFSIGGTVYNRMQSGQQNPFEVIRIAYRPGDVLFLYTDGLADQIGGPESRKLNKPRLRNLLHALASDNLRHAEAACGTALDEWKGRNPQTDDVLIAGIRL